MVLDSAQDGVPVLRVVQTFAEDVAGGEVLSVEGGAWFVGWVFGFGWGSPAGALEGGEGVGGEPGVVVGEEGVCGGDGGGCGWLFGGGEGGGFVVGGFVLEGDRWSMVEFAVFVSGWWV